jgi:hypothetical protein
MSECKNQESCDGFEPKELIDEDAMSATKPALGGNGLTKREYAAINLRVADSGLKWLDAMIKESRYRDIASYPIITKTDK